MAALVADSPAVAVVDEAQARAAVRATISLMAETPLIFVSAEEAADSLVVRAADRQEGREAFRAALAGDTLVVAIRAEAIRAAQAVLDLVEGTTVRTWNKIPTFESGSNRSLPLSSKSD